MTAPPPALLHVGRVGHARHAAPQRAFDYRYWMLSVDLDRIAEAEQASLLFRHNRRGLISLHDRDHGPRDGTPLRPWVAAQLQAGGLGEYAARIHFMVVPRVLGYAFNPIAFFFCHDSAGRLGAVLHQVKNTFGGQHGYLAPVAPMAEHGSTVHQTAAKQMHVSPFFDLDGGYEFAFSVPDFADPEAAFRLRIRYGAAGAPRMSAAMRLVARKLTDATLLRLLARMPFTPLRVMAAIHWQALQLWRGGARFHREPERPATAVSLGARV